MGKAMLAISALVVGGVLVYLYTTGQLAGFTNGASVGSAGQSVQKAKDAGQAIYAQAWFGAAVFAIVGATLLRWLWTKMSGPIRAALIVAVTIAVMVFLGTVKR